MSALPDEVAPFIEQMGRPPLDHGVRRGIWWATLLGLTPGWEHANGYVRLPAHAGEALRAVLSTEPDLLVSVHGGVTYGLDAQGWLGFDTVHAGDIWPTMPRVLRPDVALDWATHWSDELVVKETLLLADQIADLVQDWGKAQPPGEGGLGGPDDGRNHIIIGG